MVISLLQIRVSPNPKFSDYLWPSLISDVSRHELRMFMSESTRGLERRSAFVSPAKAPPAKRSEKGDGDENTTRPDVVGDLNA